MIPNTYHLYSAIKKSLLNNFLALLHIESYFKKKTCWNNGLRRVLIQLYIVEYGHKKSFMKNKINGVNKGGELFKLLSFNK